MIRRGVLGGVTALSLALLTGCEDATGVVPAELEGEGTLLSLVFIDWNGDGQPGAGDRAAREVPVELQALHGRSVRTDTTDGSGLAVFGAVPVGRYRVTVDSAALGDTLQLATADGDSAVTVARGDTAVAFVALEYPNLTTAEARAHPEGRRVVLHGTALTTGAAFGTTALHLADGEGAIRVIQAEATPAAIGDSVRVVGRTGVRAGQRVLLEAVAFHRGDGTLPPPDTLNTATAATAAGGNLDAGLAQVERARILDAQLDGAGREIVTVDDGSGALRVVLHGNARLGGELVVGGFLDVTGVLVPEEGASRFRLWPRSADDRDLWFEEVTIAEARGMASGRIVAIEAIALNARTDFGDGSMHISDPTGWIRATTVAQTGAMAGDSVRFIGRITRVHGQPVLTEVRPSVLGIGVEPGAEVATSAAAATADGGRLDAAKVRVRRAEVTERLVGADFVVLELDDGTGPVWARLDLASGFGVSDYHVGDTLTITGLLAPRPGEGDWWVRPRGPGDIERE